MNWYILDKHFDIVIDLNEESVLNPTSPIA